MNGVSISQQSVYRIEISRCCECIGDSGGILCGEIAGRVPSLPIYVLKIIIFSATPILEAPFSFFMSHFPATKHIGPRRRDATCRDMDLGELPSPGLKTEDEMGSHWQMQSGRFSCDASWNTRQDQAVLVGYLRSANAAWKTYEISP